MSIANSLVKRKLLHVVGILQQPRTALSLAMQVALVLILTLSSEAGQEHVSGLLEDEESVIGT